MSQNAEIGCPHGTTAIPRTVGKLVKPYETRRKRSFNSTHTVFSNLPQYLDLFGGSSSLFICFARWTTPNSLQVESSQARHVGVG